MTATCIGYRHGEVDTRGALHSGYDLNFGTIPDADLGRPVVAPVALRVVNTGARKHFGNYVIATSEALGYAFRFFHLDRVDCVEGSRLAAGKPLGTCGNSHFGGRTLLSAHLHYDILRVGKGSLLVWPEAGMSLEEFRRVFVDPAVLHPQLLSLRTHKGE